MLRQRRACWLAALEQWHRNLVGSVHHRGFRLRGVLLQVGELQLELVQQCAALSGLSELLVTQLPERELELLDQQCPPRRLASSNPWLMNMLDRRPPMLVIVALANNMERIVWALMARGGIYRAARAG